ncbi:DUF3224 domain-containing protein [Streptomyces hoynatensis]|uniref:DUF3224 domain-containing protein n=1 Tax=Streptomyces hoynatensis TaxID=1141874 RepID=A0A3A9ZBV5_9ACTN|nr:DUF3224 domain-containing protein [Streptomyces hoynatensis]RKN44827.1 DUF3224 domain-containing protein [Streptomyces hoynatensis]
MTARTEGTFTFSDWQEASPGGATEGARLAHAVVTNTFKGGIGAAATSCVYAISYAADGTGTFTGYERLTEATLDGRAGAFVLREWGTFEADSTVSCSFEVVPGSGEGELAGLRGSGGFTCRHGMAEVPYTFTYELG